MKTSTNLSHVVFRRVKKATVQLCCISKASRHITMSLNAEGTQSDNIYVQNYFPNPKSQQYFSYAYVGYLAPA